MSEKTQLYPYRPTHKVVVQGCDDSTTVEIALDPHEITLVEEIAELINATAEETCQPTMYVTEIK